MKIGNRHQAMGNDKKAKVLGVALCGLLLALSSFAHAQQPAKVPRIEFLAGVSPSAISARMAAFRQSIR